MRSAPYLIAAIVVSIFLGLYVNSYWQEANAELNEADKNYSAGENAASIAERKEHFNRALDIYKKLEARYDPSYGNGLFYYNLGNIYYQLEEYPMAVLYYQKALSLSPGDSKASGNLSLTLKKLSLEPEQEKSAFAPLFFFREYFPLPVRLQVFTFLTVIALTLASLYIWSGQAKKASIFFATLCLLLGLILLYTRYVAPIDGIIVKSSYLYRDAGRQYARVNDQPLPGGSKVEVKSYAEDGSWLKVETSDGAIGFVPADSLMVI